MAVWRLNSHEAYRLAVAAALAVSAVSCSVHETFAPGSAMQKRVTADVNSYNVTPVRGDRRPLRLHRDGDAFECTVCHDSFPDDIGLKALEGEHKDIVFDHGLNLRCLNCHHPKNSMAYVYHDGSEIPDDQPTRLCAKCHGPHYREWMLGIHGRINGYWTAKLGEQEKLDCIQCHDPHRPRIHAMAPEPPTILTRFEATPNGEPSNSG